MLTRLAKLNEYIGYTAFIGVEDTEIMEEEKNLFEILKKKYAVDKLNEFRKTCQWIGEDRHINGSTIADIQLKQEIYTYFGY